MIAQTAQDKLLQAIAEDEDHGYFDILRANEPGICLCENKDHSLESCTNKFQIDWVMFAAKLYRRSHSTSTVTSYCKGICAFREMQMQCGKTLVQTVEEIRGQTNGLAYKLLDNFVTYCDATKQYAPRTTRNYFQSVTRLFDFVEIELDERRLKNIEMPRPSAIKDEIPSNEDLRKIDSAASLTIRGFTRLMRDTGFEPVDAAELQVKDFKFNEDPVRINKDREKTGEPLEGFLSQDTVDTIKQIISFKNKQPDDYIFSDTFNGYTLKSLRDRYNFAVAKAGFGKIVRQKNGRRYLGIVDKIEGHKFGKFHLKVYKKRWFTLVISAGVPEYVAQGMLGRKQYLDEYLRLSLEKKQEFARKILKTVNIYAGKVDTAEIRKQAAAALGLEDVTPEQMATLKAILKQARMPNSPLHKLLSGETA